MLYGALTEFGQHFLVYRQGDITDYIADVFGILFFALLKFLYTLVKKKMTKSSTIKQINIQ
ncbi:hypothetical protein D1094_15125 [Colwellia sp. RSH04]|nr:hypothetical protein D1094_15125 [Colwellia sp. RSH04]